MASRLRPRGTSELIDVMFALLREHYVSFLTIVALGFTPVIAVFALGAVVSGTAIPTGDLSLTALGVSTLSAASALTIGAFMVLVLPCVMLVQGALIFAASDAYLDDAVDVGGVLRRSARAIPSTFGAYAVAMLIAGVGYVCLFVPGIYAYGAVFALPAIILLEDRGVGESVGRAFALTKGRKRAVLGALFLTTFVVSIMQSMFGAIAGLAGPYVGVAARIAVTIALYPVSTVMVVLLYYDVRIRAEGFDLEWEVAAMSAPAA